VRVVSGVMRTTIGLAAGALFLASCAAQVSAPPQSAAGDELVLRTSSAVQVWDAKGDLVRSIGRAVASPDGSVYYGLDGSAPTTLRWTDAKTGRPITQLGLPGAYAFASEAGPAPAGFSPNGRWLVLVGEVGAKSSFAIVDTSLVKLAAFAEIPGPFTYDAISDDGTSLYLIERITPEAARELPGVNAAYGYRVRVYDVPAGKMSETLVVDVKLASQTDGNNAETRLDGIMSGIYQSSVPSRDGRWNFSFYYNPSRGPFIHVLHLDSRSAFCILDLPLVAGGFEKRLGWSLALTPSGKTLYAVNGPLGLVSVIDATTLKVGQTATVSGLPAPATTIESPASAAVSRDARKLYFTAQRGVALVDTSDLSLRGFFLGDHVITSLSLTQDGRRLYALSSDGTVWMLDATTGRELGQIPTRDAVALLRVR
jgi:YVTN family beta-propeller protein